MHQGGTLKQWRTLIAALLAAMLLPFVVEFVVSLLPFIGIIGTALAGLVIACCISGGFYTVALAYHNVAMMRIRRQREYFSRRFVVAGTIVAFHQEDGEVRNLSAEQLQLPAPITLEEEQPASMADVPPDHWRILDLWGKGMDLRNIALACGTTYYRVQKITSQWKDKMKKAG